jgi:V-type H+-transporting ATPase subunit H
VSCFVHLNKHSELADVFLENNGTALIIECLNKGGNDIQLIYYSLLNVWMLSFTENGIGKFLSIPKYGIIKSMCEILQKVSR